MQSLKPEQVLGPAKGPEQTGTVMQRGIADAVTLHHMVNGDGSPQTIMKHLKASTQVYLHALNIHPCMQGTEAPLRSIPGIQVSLGKEVKHALHPCLRQEDIHIVYLHVGQSIQGQGTRPIYAPRGIGLA